MTSRNQNRYFAGSSDAPPDALDPRSEQPRQKPEHRGRDDDLPPEAGPEGDPDGEQWLPDALRGRDFA